MITPSGGHGACPGCALPMGLRTILKVLGHKIAIIIPPGCVANMLNQPRYLLTCPEWNVQELTVGFGTSATNASGVKAAFEVKGDNETQVLALTGDGATLDIGIQSLSSCAERNENIIYVCFDNEAYQNTGNQRSSSTPLHGNTTTTPLPGGTKRELKKDIMLIMAAHNIPYAASCSVAYPDDTIEKVKKAKEANGFRFLYFYAPCVAGWRMPSDTTVKVARLAVETKLFPLYEVTNGTNFTITHESKGIPVGEYLKTQGRFRHFTPEMTAELQQMVDHKWEYLKWLAAFGKKSSRARK